MAKASTAGKGRKAASKSASKTTSRRTAPAGESEPRQRTRTDAQARSGRKRTSSGRATEDQSFKRSQAEHSEHPENPGDSTVRHAVPTARAGEEGQKGFPQGEYDVTPPAKEPARGKRSLEDQLIEQHVGDQDVEAIERALKSPKANRLNPKQRALAIEALPIGSVLEHEGAFRWRVTGRGTGGNRYGHGATAQEAIDNYVLGSSVTDATQAGAQAFTELPKSVQKEIEERDAAVAKRQGLSPDSLPEQIARREFVENQKAAQKAARPAPNAATDGSEVASAQLEQGTKRGRAEGASEAEAEGRKGQAARKRSSARRRTGAKAKR